MSQYFEEVYFDVEKAIELAFDSKFVLNFYEYLKLKGAKKVEVDQFLSSSTAKEIISTIDAVSYTHLTLPTTVIV